MEEARIASRLNAAWKLIFLVGASYVVFGMELAVGGFVPFSDPTFGFAQNPFRVSYGVALTGQGALTCGLAIKGYRRGEKWAWTSLLIAGSVVYGWHLGLNVVGLGSHSLPTLVGIPLFFIFLVGILLPIQKFLSSKNSS